MIITILSEYTIIPNSTNTMILTTVALVLVTAVLMSSARGYSYNTAHASSFTKRSYTNCEGHACHSLICINDEATTSAKDQFQL